MRHLIAHRYTIRQYLLNILGICLCVYFSYHAAFGIRSYFHLTGLEKETARLGARYESLYQQRKELESRVVRLRPVSLDPDLLEEQARIMLGYSRRDEHILLYGSQ